MRQLGGEGVHPWMLGVCPLVERRCWCMSGTPLIRRTVIADQGSSTVWPNSVSPLLRTAHLPLAPDPVLRCWRAPTASTLLRVLLIPSIRRSCELQCHRIETGSFTGIVTSWPFELRIRAYQPSYRLAIIQKDHINSNLEHIQLPQNYKRYWYYRPIGPIAFPPFFPLAETST